LRIFSLLTGNIPFPTISSLRMAQTESIPEFPMRTDMAKTDKSPLLAPLTPDETRWAMELADKLPDGVDLTFEEVKILTRVTIDRWPKKLLGKVRDVIDLEDFLDDTPED
jgi:hypothetical protein